MPQHPVPSSYLPHTKRFHPRISKPGPQGGPGRKPGRPRGRPPAARPPTKVVPKSADSRIGIPGFDLSPHMSNDQDPPQSPRTASTIIAPVVTSPPPSIPLTIDEDQLSIPESPASSQDLFIPRQTKQQSSSNRQPGREQPPLGNRRNDPASIPEGPT
ncbi:hypothetical protein JTE90_021135 [Oedothorax gibbosus]|uniref:Uncharacterized protein n=1 Tax=Oedothorax gibbosus TaxID=931172 RepID=A0AAV6U072_9ARAC|nr:hypothetical protein JTE90_021135 [Oedothorax gibbosus]